MARLPNPGEDEVYAGLLCDPLPVPQLHQDVEGGVEQQVHDEDGQQKGGKVAAVPGELLDAVDGHAPVAHVEDAEEDHPIGVHGPEGGQGAGAAGARVVPQHLPHAPGQAGVDLPAPHVVDLDGEQEAADHVETSEGDPEGNVATALNHAKDTNEDDKGEDATGSVG